MSRDEAVAWLNDRLDQPFHVSIELEQGDYSVSLLEAEGTLRWRQHEPERLAGHSREDLIGYYAVGESAHFDLSDLEHCTFAVNEPLDSLDVVVGETLTLRITEQE